MENYDLLRASVFDIDTIRISKALNWLQDGGLFPTPVSVHFNLTTRCSCRCIHCKQWTWPDNPELTIKDIRKIFDTFQSWQVRTITLAGGNPLLHHSFIEVCEAARQRDIKIGIITEGGVLDDLLLETIGTHVQWIRFSLDGPEAKIHESIRNRDGLFNQVMDNIKRLASTYPNLHIGLNCVVQKLNIYHLSEMIDLAKDIRVKSLFFKIPHGEDRERHYLLNPEEWQYLSNWTQNALGTDTSPVQTNLGQLTYILTQIVNKEDALSGRPIRTFYIENNIHCYVPMFFLICNSQGDVYPCCYLLSDNRKWDSKYNQIRSEHYLGNILTDEEEKMLTRIGRLVRSKIYDYPRKGYPECGCCTRFCQFNAAISELDAFWRGRTISESSLSRQLNSRECQRSPFL